MQNIKTIMYIDFTTKPYYRQGGAKKPATFLSRLALQTLFNVPVTKSTRSERMSRGFNVPINTL